MPLMPKPTLGDAPIEAAYRQKMEQMARLLDGILNGSAKGADRESGFLLLVFPFGERPGRCNYISNGADRQDVIALLKQQIARFEGQAELQGRA